MWHDGIWRSRSYSTSRTIGNNFLLVFFYWIIFLSTCIDYNPVRLVWYEFRISGSDDFLILKISSYRGSADQSPIASLWNVRISIKNESAGLMKAKVVFAGNQLTNEREEEVWFTVIDAVKSVSNAKPQNSKTQSELSECACPVPFLSLEQWLGTDCKFIVDFLMLQWTAMRHAYSRMLSDSLRKKNSIRFFHKWFYGPKHLWYKIFFILVSFGFSSFSLFYDFLPIFNLILSANIHNKNVY